MAALDDNIRLLSLQIDMHDIGEGGKRLNTHRSRPSLVEALVTPEILPLIVSSSAQNKLAPRSQVVHTGHGLSDTVFLHLYLYIYRYIAIAIAIARAHFSSGVRRCFDAFDSFIRNAEAKM